MSRKKKVAAGPNDFFGPSRKKRKRARLKGKRGGRLQETSEFSSARVYYNSKKGKGKKILGGVGRKGDKGGQQRGERKTK